MNSLTYTVAFEGIEARTVEVQCAISPGIPAFSIVGLPDKAVSEARERVRASLAAMAIALPPKRITVNLSPADLPKAGSHFDLPIVLALLAAIEIIPNELAKQTLALGELSLDGGLVGVSGALPAAMTAATMEKQLICPQSCGSEAAWVGAAKVIAPRTLADAIRHLNGQALIAPSAPGEVTRVAHTRHVGRSRARTCQARLGNRRRRPPSHANDRFARVGEIHARRPLTRNIATA